MYKSEDCYQTIQITLTVVIIYQAGFIFFISAI